MSIVLLVAVPTDPAFGDTASGCSALERRYQLLTVADTQKGLRQSASMTMRRVWVDSWQMQCCGAPFGLGSKVSWSTVPVIDRSWFDEFLDRSTAASITDHEEHHAEDPNVLGVTSGVVRSIDAVYCRYSLDGCAASPVAGSAELRPRSSADGWEEETRDDEWVEPRFVGYLVQLEVVSRE